MNNTVLVVDHNQDLRKIADRAFFLGPKGGINGGRFIQEKDYLLMQNRRPLPYDPGKLKESKKVNVTLNSDYVNYSGRLELYENALNGLCGASGIGKTTILRDILPSCLDGYKYIAQKPIKANRNSNVASYTGLLDEICTYYAKKTEKEKSIFSLYQKGACVKCGGRGSILAGDFYDEQLYVDCEECRGTGYTKYTLEQRVDNLNISEFLNLNIEQFIENHICISKKFDKTIQLLERLGLGHLSLGQRVSSLSGGENQRIKLSQALGESRIKIYGLDEPLMGLGKREMLDLTAVIYENIVDYGKTFIISEHNTEFLKMCSFVNELVRDKDRVKIVVRYFMD